MKELSCVNQKILRNDANGATVQLRTEENQIVVFSVSSKGTTCSCGSKSVKIPTELARTTSLSNLLVQLEKSRFSVKGGSLSLIGSRIGNNMEGDSGGDCVVYTFDGICPSNFFRSASGKIGGVMEDTCGSHGECGADAPICGGDACGGNACGGNIPVCADNASGRLGGVGKPSIKPSLKKTK